MTARRPGSPAVQIVPRSISRKRPAPVALQAINSPVTFLPDANGRYPRRSMPFGGFRETREVFNSIFNLVVP